MARKTYRILSLDGGGIRGLMTAIWLQRLEALLPKALHTYFDLVAGTSTGSILACGISRGFSAEKIVQMYTQRGKEVFPSLSWRLLSRASRLFSDGTSAPKYDGKGLEKVLKDVFKTALFGSLKIKPTMVTSYDTFSRTPVVFKSYREAHKKLRVWEVCKASSSAPTYFPAHILTIGGADTPLIDGGMFANNPTACAIAEAVRINKDRGTKGYDLNEVLVASFGTGEATRPITAESALEWGALEWAIPIVDVLFDGSADAVNYVATQLLEPDNYYRFQVPLDDAYDDMDNADRTNLNALTLIATSFIDSGVGKKQLQDLAKRLQES